MREKQILHFTLGPVQSFVAQARRTRDLWAGSYLLSYLSGRAMLAVQPTQDSTVGRIIFPSLRGDVMMKKLWGQTLTDDEQKLLEQTGSLPNRFAAEVEDNQAGEKARDAIKVAWNAIAEAVKGNFVVTAGSDKITDEIWERQTKIENAWACSWVYGANGALLDQRKNLRTFFLQEEPGEKCTVCGERQEISGKGLGTSESRRKMCDWWVGFRSKEKFFDLRDDERLCAVCLTKRLFPKVAKEAIDWQVPTGFPSVVYMAAVEWIEQVMAKGGKPEVDKAIQDFVKICGNAKVGHSEKETRITGITEKLQALHDGHWQTFADLDGNVFFEDAIRSKNSLSFLKAPTPDKEKETRQEIVGKLKAIHQAVGIKATPFYAMLLMDGDSMGALLTGCKNDSEKEMISSALGVFGTMVPDKVKGCDGRLIYCGGDDVFALMPMEQALKCARWCREAYQAAFQEKASFVKKERATVSAAIIYAHIRVPLSVVVRQAHKLLTGVAKDKTGRDAIACQVYKPGGITLTWAMPWNKALGVKEIVNHSGPQPASLVQEVLHRFQDNSGGSAQFSSKFFYRAHDLFEVLADAEGKEVFKQNETKALLTADYLANRELKWPDKDWTKEQKREEAGLRVERLLALCTEYRRKPDTKAGTDSIDPTGYIHVDGALLVRFLAQKGVER